MTEFESFLAEYRREIERFVYFKISSKADADDVLQEVYLAAFQKFYMLSNKSNFKAWVISIARNKCNDYYRRKRNQEDVSFEEIEECALTASRYGYIEQKLVYDTIDSLSDNDRQILSLFFICGYNQHEISEKLNIPVGTVKSRLHTARNHFKTAYLPDVVERKVDENMTKLPEKMPEYTIKKHEKEPFPVKWEELMGWFIVPRLGEKLSWAMYDFPERKRSEYVELQVISRAEVHGIKGVEVTAKEYNPMECNKSGEANPVERSFIAQLTDTHCRILAESHMCAGVKKCYTFLDGEEFLANWGFGENNCGNEINLSPKGDIIRQKNNITAAHKQFLLDIVGRYEVKIGDKTYDTVCIVDIETYNNGTLSEQYVDEKGRTILWRRFNKNDWAIERYQKSWT
uniref:RNA polymerase sigma factor n=1 Tax=Acetatifactor sp. TaxID=1872090 RepID=UPI004056E4E8